MNTLNSFSPDLEKFSAKLISLGGLVTSSQKIPSNEFIDLEIFFLESTQAVFSDSRLSRCIEHWVKKHALLLSPSRLLLLLKNHHIPYNPSSLGALLMIADEKFPYSGKFKNLSKYCQKNTEPVFMFPFLKKTKGMKFDERWLSFGILAPLFLNNESAHFLTKTEDHIPELKYRQLGIPASVANICVYFEKNPSSSIYMAAKVTKVTYAYAHRVCTKLKLGPLSTIKMHDFK